MKVNIVWVDEKGEHEETKTFKDDIAALAWCRVHYKNIAAINDNWTFGEPVNHFILLDFIKNRNLFTL